VNEESVVIRVQVGDNLSDLALKYYGDPKKGIGITFIGYLLLLWDILILFLGYLPFG